MINNVTLIGRLTRTPELRSTQTGVPVTNFTIACNRNFGDKDQADFINCVAWRHSAEFLCNYMKKGNFIGFEIDEEYHKIATDRVNGINAHGQTSIFTFMGD